MDPIFLDLAEVRDIHTHQIEKYGGSLGIRDLGMLQSALAQPSAMFGGVFLHEDVFAMAAAYMFHIVQNHPFVDGNKRVGFEATLMFLKYNDLTLHTDKDALTDLVLAVAQGQANKDQIAWFLRQHSQPSGA